jgi:hypothetical protein
MDTEQICYIRRNFMTEDPIIYEICDLETGNTLTFGSEPVIDEILRTNEWQPGNTVIVKDKEFNLIVVP